MLATRSLMRNAKVMQMMLRSVALGMESKSPLSLPQNDVNSDVFAGTLIARMVHEDSNQYKINVNKKLGPDANPYAHTPDKINPAMASQLEEEHDFDFEGLLYKQYNDDSVVRPYGSFSEQNVAAERSDIDPLSDARKARKGKLEAEENAAADNSPIYGGK